MTSRADRHGTKAEMGNASPAGEGQAGPAEQDANPVLKWTGISLVAVFTVFAALFAAGDAMSDPGGLAGLGLTLLWVVPLTAAATLARRRPSLATRLLAVLVGVVLALDAAATATGSTWSDFEDHHGPVRGIVTVAVAGPLAVLALKRPGPAALMLLITGVGVCVLAPVAGGPGAGPLVFVGAVIAAAGALICLSVLAGHPTHRAARPEPDGARRRV